MQLIGEGSLDAIDGVTTLMAKKAIIPVITVWAGATLRAGAELVLNDESEHTIAGTLLWVVKHKM